MITKTTNANAPDLRRYEKDESRNLQRIVETMNTLHAKMGGRDRRPERLALLRCMDILTKEINASRGSV